MSTAVVVTTTSRIPLPSTDLVVMELVLQQSLAPGRREGG
jgi:hypothetical protein